MIDLSITKDPEWIKQREMLWKPIGKMLSADLRKDNLEKIHKYFLTGDYDLLKSFGVDADAGAFCWFPIQAPDAWNYLFESVVKDKKYYEYFFYLSLEDLSHRALNKEEELLMWDYFMGGEFKPTVTSEVPVGEQKEFVIFEVDKWKVAANFVTFIDYWIKGKKDYSNYKMKNRVSYFITMLPYFSEQEFLEKDSDGDLLSNAAYCANKFFKLINGVNVESENTPQTLIDFVSVVKSEIENIRMPAAMRQYWVEAGGSNGNT